MLFLEPNILELILLNISKSSNRKHVISSTQKPRFRSIANTSKCKMGLSHHMYSEQVHICTLPCVRVCTSAYTSWYIYVPRRIRGGTHMYSLVYVRVHVCTPRIRQGTCMYPDVYEGVHTCTPSYTLGYMYLPPLIRLGT